ncbi:MAG: AGE family epimerase/isomerase [Anaerolineae bacterium]
MQPERIDSLIAQYQAALLDDVIPFWLAHSLDEPYGGYLTCLDRDGSVYDTDKGVWLQARQVWMLSKLYNAVERRAEWLEAAQLGYRFLAQHAFDSDGRLFFALTRDGRPLRKRRYLFAEAFAVIGCAEYARATGDEQALQRARDTYRLMVQLQRTPGVLPPKVIPETRATKGLAMPMILLATTQELRLVDQDPLYEEVVERAIWEVTHHFLHAEEHALHETVGPQGERLDSSEGRCVNPGHSIETAWFLLHEAEQRRDAALRRTALDILDWSLERGWDPEHGGLLAFVDIEGKPPAQLEWDMKLWWPHTEALYATLLAHHLTGEERYLAWYERLHAWTWGHFPDPAYGEWFGYLHRDGSRALSLKGSLWKGCFHVPRSLWLCLRLLQTMRAG